MYRLRIVNTNVVPSDHLLDVDGLPPVFVQNLPLQPKINWISKDKPEYMIDYKSNQWDELEQLMNRFAHNGKIPKPANLVNSDDPDRARILPPTLKDEEVPLLVLDTPEAMRKEEDKVAAPISYSCPECDFDAKGQSDIEAHMTARHGIDLAQRGQDGKTMAVPKAPTSPKVYACVCCEFETIDKSALLSHSMTHEKPAETKVSSPFACLEDDCQYVAESAGQLRGHKMGAHKKQKVGV